MQRVAHRERRPGRRLRPTEPGRPWLLDSHQHESGPQLRNAMLAGIYQVPPCLITQIMQPLQDPGPVTVEPTSGKTPYVLQQHSARTALFHQAKGLREQVPLIILAELLSRDREGRARHTSRNQVDISERTTIYIGQIGLDNLPLRAPVEAKRLAGSGVKLYHALMCEPCLLKAERLPAGPGADLEATQLSHGTPSAAVEADSVREYRQTEPFTLSPAASSRCQGQQLLRPPARLARTQRTGLHTCSMVLVTFTSLARRV